MCLMSALCASTLAPLFSHWNRYIADETLQRPFFSTRTNTHTHGERYDKKIIRKYTRTFALLLERKKEIVNDDARLDLFLIWNYLYFYAFYFYFFYFFYFSSLLRIFSSSLLWRCACAQANDLDWPRVLFDTRCIIRHMYLMHICNVLGSTTTILWFGKFETAMRAVQD